MGRNRRERAEPTDEWEWLVPLFEWPEQERYEAIRPLVLFDSSVTERAGKVGVSERTLYRRVERFDQEGMSSLFDAESAKPRKLPPAVRRLIVDLKAEHPALSLGEVARICYVRFGRRPSKHTIRRILAEEPTPLRMAAASTCTTRCTSRARVGLPSSGCTPRGGRPRASPPT